MIIVPYLTHPYNKEKQEQYMSEDFAKNTPKLGFGLMRLPNKGIGKDIRQISRMVDMFMEAGFTYFDTAYVYPGSENAIRKALVERYPRESFTLADKMNAFIMAPTEKAAKKQFLTSLERTGAGYFDYYLLHSLMDNNYKKYEKFHLWEYCRQLKEEGKIRRFGFSFHGTPELLEQLLAEHPEVDFIQLQINYADWERKSVSSRANYEISRRHNVPVTIMEPVKGGALADPPKEVKKLFDEYAPGQSYASWAIRYCASLDGILTVLSGMSNTDQMQDNLSYMRNFQPLNSDEMKIIQEAQRIMGNSSAIPCTACSYCTKGCPQEIRIPDIFAAANLQLANGQILQARKAYAEAAPEGHRPTDCIKCRQCEQACPQHLPITDYLKQAENLLEV